MLVVYDTVYSYHNFNSSFNPLYTDTQTPEVLTKAKELLEIVRKTVMIPKNLAGELHVGLICHLSC